MLTFVTDRQTDGRKIWEGEIADILTKMMMHTQTNKTYISIDRKFLVAFVHHAINIGSEVFFSICRPIRD